MVSRKGELQTQTTRSPSATPASSHQHPAIQRCRPTTSPPPRTSCQPEAEETPDEPEGEVEETPDEPEGEAETPDEPEDEAEETPDEPEDAGDVDATTEATAEDAAKDTSENIDLPESADDDDDDGADSASVPLAAIAGAGIAMVVMAVVIAYFVMTQRKRKNSGHFSSRKSGDGPDLEGASAINVQVQSPMTPTHIHRN